ncbi:MAG: hypothetical protein A3J51_02060 [Omnitrophica WOR_2 bacterium RIFCSPHIGHO2_02_FULL_45_21]|nr:MAG: hypothetical protein A3J51_02060 [Omnitrophica WOR_2 bacterium RIFCSPHIGHO2_02_FULL_45_21]
MAEIIPFRGLRFNQEKIRELKLALSPPYDVISAAEQSRLYKAHKYNVVRIILGKEKKSDDALHNRYSRARGFFKSWLRQGILIQDKKPSIYIYEQSYIFEGRRLRRIGFIALLKLEPPDKGVILAHEKTFSKPREDRLKLLQSTEANLSPIFGLYPDEHFIIERLLAGYRRTASIADFEFEGTRNRLWRIDSSNFIQALTKLIRRKIIFIADGHHRYEAAYYYKKLMSKKRALNASTAFTANPELSRRISADYVMMYFCNLASGGLKILPTHRVIRNIPKVELATLPLILQSYFTILPVSSRKELFSRLRLPGASPPRRASQHEFGLYLKDKGFYLLKLKQKTILNTDKPPRLRRGDSRSHSCYNSLDVVILHNLILDKLIGIKEENAGAQNILYTRDEQEAMRLVKNQEYDCAFFLNPPSPRQVSAIAARSLRKMPHKSTYFYPKPLSGLVINGLGKNAAF